MRYPLCNNRNATAPRLFGARLPLCCRCCGVTVGVGICALVGGAIPESPLNFALAALGILACAGDGYLSYYSAIGSTNTRRLITGVLGGFGAGILVA